jgi:hypothetical protein
MKADDWKFYQHENGGWSWGVLGINAKNSSRQFSGIVEAMADAVTYGFTPGVSRVAEITSCRRLVPR